MSTFVEESRKVFWESMFFMNLAKKIATDFMQAYKSNRCSIKSVDKYTNEY